MKILKDHISIVLAVLLSFLLFMPVEGITQTHPVIGLHQNTPNVIAFTNVMIVVSPIVTLENAVLVIRDEQIVDVGQSIKIPPDAVVHDLKGKTIYPGFIDLYTNYGIKEQAQQNQSSEPDVSDNKKGSKHWNDAVQSSKKTSEILQPDKKPAENFRKSGITTVLCFPQTGLFRGIGSLVSLKDQEPSRITLNSDFVQALSFSKGRRGGGYPGSLMGSIALIRQTMYDAKWYHEAWLNYNQSPLGQKCPETNLDLAALQPYIIGQKPFICSTSTELDILRSAKISNEFGLEMWVLGSGFEYRRLQAVKNTQLKLIIPVNFPKKPNVSTPENESELDLRTLRHWDSAPENPSRLAKAGIEFALTSSLLEKKEDFLKQIRVAVKRGLSAETAIQALTMTPAKWLNMSNLLGSVEKGKLANFMVTDGELFDDKTQILDVWVAGEKYKINEYPEVDIRGTWKLNIVSKSWSKSGDIVFSGTPSKPSATFQMQNKKVKAKTVSVEDKQISCSFAGDSLGEKGFIRLSGLISANTMSGAGLWVNGQNITWQVNRIKDFVEKADTTKVKAVQMASFSTVYPDGAFGRTAQPVQPELLLIKNTTIWTSGPEGIIENGDMLVKNGKISNVGKNIKAPSGAAIIDAKGKHLSPGIIDDHSHIAASGGLNEMGSAITSEVRVEDVLDCDDINIYRLSAGGVTASCVLHGSANPVGGTYSVIKHRWGALPDELIIKGHKPGIKFALGENVKQSNRPNITTPRYPQTRMGVMEIMRSFFEAAKDYRSEWDLYKTNKKKNKFLIPPRKNLRLEPFLEILDKNMIIHCHAYRHDEVLATMRLAEETGFKIDLFIHVFEGYKVAEEMRKHGAMATCSSDWWAYKMEAYDAIPYNGALMFNQNVVVAYNSDSAELARRLNTETAKAAKYGGVPLEEALKFVTINSAKHLYLDKRIGSLEPGKDADFVIWSGSPLSTFSICEQTWIDGRKYFDIEEDKKLREKVREERTTIVQKILDTNDDKNQKPK